jgi:predicted nucleotide-binding protein (sugar kinase/HSP70/actin superfamily)
LNELINIKSISALNITYKKYVHLFNRIEIDKPVDCLKVGIVGELYTLMEPFSNYYIEKELAKNKIQVSRFITVSFILFKKTKIKKQLLKEAGKYLKFEIGADGTDSVSKTRMLAEKGYDGIIHLKPFGCTPEVNAMPMLQNIGRDYKIPILYFSFDSQTSETGVKTRLEAFYDMLSMRKEKTVCKQDI